MKEISNGYYDGERPLFGLRDAAIKDVTFGTGESPLKEGRNLDLDGVLFTWKYPLWYDKHVKVKDTIFETMARSGIWYTDDITITDSTIQAPKQLRRCQGVTLDRVHFSNAEETMWTCKDIRISNVTVNGDYFGMNSENVYVDHLDLVGNYCFDGAKNVEVHNSRLVAKDAFWNCENVTIYDSRISGEYLAWNTKNITLVNCTIESDQGLCYIDGLTMRNCRTRRTDLAFEYCRDIDAEITGDIMSIKNPVSGKIKVGHADDIILDDPEIDFDQVEIETAD
ncbi:hypothetical protein lacNasYZ03_12460 [Lactobacillus nasalidis]|uniref:DUF3737 family protein n=1 Tax=Lactobacillus nasalidis TaxID=2797258 RepID=A0ABQ3W894_9LACO|nr:DUF3737 family protein [Lactobacillus nasalidis]GHV98132.1 hypothetical protein lacNasYZ01_13140 [Lactobacillus nasalidis]GHW00198.1 hypothetical protein lacNasYZ02_16270 [Lactobacillus nasalidis]GHW01559.1 hypothetical protein lacNasYZ03_12460 [Lactobacillus nasalidis]